MMHLIAILKILNITSFGESESNKLKFKINLVFKSYKKVRGEKTYSKNVNC